MPTIKRKPTRPNPQTIHADVNVNKHPSMRGEYYLTVNDEEGHELREWGGIEVQGKREALSTAMSVAADLLLKTVHEVTVFYEGDEYAYASKPRGFPLKKSNIRTGGRR